MKAVTIGPYRIRERKGKVYVYVFENGHERYVGPLGKIISTWEGRARVDPERRIQVENDVSAEREGSKVATKSANYPSGNTERDLAEFYNFCVKSVSESTCKKYRRLLEKPPNGTANSVKAWRLYWKWKGEPQKGKEMKIPRSGSDLRYVSEEEVIGAIRKADERSRYLLFLLLESGARLTELVKVLGEFDGGNDVKQGSESTTYYIYTLNWQRGKKRSFYFFHMSPLREMTLSYMTTEKKLSRYIAPKLIRKFVATKMFELGMPAEVIDYIQGRSPSSVATRHYIYLLATSQRYYQEKWIPYLRTLLDGLGISAENTETFFNEK